ncbi:hypothetical protein [Neorhizobium sp. DAR64872/K0K18]|uniref:hypothetical protein n=1 Tax=Neorhizobium sp. DAR64872/K0K18 TaxID=3421958 RepID=UPI003D2BE416
MTTTGSNSKLSDADRQKLFASHFREELEIENAKRALAARRTANRKMAKSYEPSFSGQKFDHYLKAHFGEDDQKPVDRLKSDRENLEWLGLIAETSSGDLLKQADRVDGEQLIRAKGYKSGLLNLDRVSGYDSGSSDDKLWLESFDAGRAEYDAEIPDILARIAAAASKEEDASSEDPFPAGED